jgi:hypothetical protein
MVSPFWTPNRVQVLFGEPIDLSEFQGRRPSRELLDEVAQRLMETLARLGGAPAPRGTAAPIYQIRPEASRTSDERASA